MITYIGIVAAATLGVGAVLYYQPRKGFDTLARIERVGLGPGSNFYSQTLQKKVAFTIDDAPYGPTTPAILDVLHEHSVSATFFCMSKAAEENSEIVKQIVTAGHQLGHHMTEDTPSFKLSFDEFVQRFDQAKAVLDEAAGKDVVWFRPASARFTQGMRAYAESKGTRIIIGDVFPYDTHIKNSGFATRMIQSGVRPGSVVILHDGQGRGNHTKETLSRVIPLLKQDGYEFVTLDELFDASSYA